MQAILGQAFDAGVFLLFAASFLALTCTGGRRQP